MKSKLEQIKEHYDEGLISKYEATMQLMGLGYSTTEIKGVVGDLVSKRKRAYMAEKLVSDMVRYSGVGQPITTKNGFVFVKPNNLNYNWVKNGVGRTASFGVKAYPGWWDGVFFTIDLKAPRGY